MTTTQRRRGFTLVELLVVIAIIGVLVGLLLPAINAARETARQATCTNNLKELALAATNYQTSRDHFPGLVQLEKMATSVSVDYFPDTPSQRDIEVSWAGKLLPQLDSAGTWDSLIQGNLNLSANLNSNRDDLPQLSIFLCPSEARTSANDPGLSYVANSGAADHLRSSTNDDPSDFAENGIFHNRISSQSYFQDGPRVSSNIIKDGSSMTLLFSENVQRDVLGGNVNTSWLRSSALLSGDPLAEESVYGMMWVVDSNSPLDPSQAGTQFRFNQEPVVPTNSYAAQTYQYARPSSEHPEVFIAAFADGHTKAIRANIEYRVYQQLMTCKGAKARWPGTNSVGGSIQANSLDTQDLYDLVPAFVNGDPALQLSESDFQ